MKWILEITATGSKKEKEKSKQFIKSLKAGEFMGLSAREFKKQEVKK